VYIAFVEASELRTDTLADDLWEVLRLLESMQTSLAR
jgi:hypothetical protein